MEFVTDVGNGEVGLAGDFFVAEAGDVFEGDEGFVGFGESCDEELEGADGFEFPHGGIGIEGWSFKFHGVLRMGFDGSRAFVVANVVEGEVADAAEQPGAGGFDLVPEGVEPHERVLNNVLGGLALPEDAEGVTQESGFLGVEYLA